MSDVIQELCNEFPEIEKSSIEKICKYGLSGVRKLIKQDEELIVHTEGCEEIKFFIPCGPDVQEKITQHNVMRRRIKELKNKDGQTSK